MNQQKTLKHGGFPYKALVMITLSIAIVCALLGLNTHYAKSKKAPVTLAEAAASFSRKSVPVETTPVRSTPKPVVNINRDVCVFNGTAIPDLARTVATQLQEKGWNIGNYSNYAGEPKTVTTISYPKGQKASAEKLQADYPNAKAFEIQIPENTTCPGKLVLILMGQ